jgi:hypothetical protein
MNTVSSRFTTWLAGYYEDFQSTRTISEGEDYDSTDFFTNRRDSHAGNTMAAQALANPRFTYDYLTRSFASKAPIALLGSAAASESPSLHNEGPSQWLTYDENRIGSAFYEGRATLSYPDTIGDAASLRTFFLPRRADFSRMASGWGTQNEYWVRHGDTDSTYERSSFTVPATGMPYGTSKTRGYGKFDIAFLQPTDTSGVPLAVGNTQGADFSNYRKHKIMMSSSLCGVYMGETGEIIATSGGIGLPYAYLFPIKSPSGKPFFRHSFSRRVSDWLTTSGVVSDGGKNRWSLNHTTQFVDVGPLAADDQWFFFESKLLNVQATGQTYLAGATTITIPASLPTPPADTARILDPSNDRHLPDKSSGTPTQTFGIEAAILEYTSISINGAGDVTFTLTTPLAAGFIQPTIYYYVWKDQEPNDNALYAYNINTTGVPDPTATVFQNRQSTSLGKPLICFKNSSNVVLSTLTARTGNSEPGSGYPAWTVTTTTSKGYNIYQVHIQEVDNPDGFSTDPDNNIASDPFFKIGNVYGRLEAGDYIIPLNARVPEKITSMNTDGTISTDVDWTYNVAVSIKQATYGAYSSNKGRPVDGMFGFQPVIVGDTELNATTDGERFTIRLAHQSFDTNQSGVPGDVVGIYNLAVGYCQTQTGFSLNERGNMAGSKAAITHTFVPNTGLGLNAVHPTLWTQWEEGGTTNSYTMDQLWYDLEVVIDFTNQQYEVFCDGSSVGGITPFNAKYDASAWTAADFYGWSLGVQQANYYDLADQTSWVTSVTMIDRAAYIYALDHRLPTSMPTNTEDFIVDSFKIVKLVDGISSMDITVIDDTDLLNLPQLASGRPNWKLLLFRDNVDRPIHSAIVSNVQWKQNVKRKTKELVMKANDSIGELDFQFPYFDIGQEEGAPSLVAAYRRYEVTNYANIFHFGATSLLNLNMFLGLDSDSKGSTGEYLPRYDQRSRLYSGHPIQMYSNENTNGPNYVEDSWEASRRIDYFMPDSNDPTKTRAVFTSDAIKYSEDQIPAGVKVAIKGNWRNVGATSGVNTSIKSLPEFGERGYLSSYRRGSSPENTPHNVMRGEWTTQQAQTVTTGNMIATYNFLTVADTALFPASGTVAVGGSGATLFGSTNYTYTSKTATQLNITGTLGVPFGAGTTVRETSSTDYIIIPQTWQNSIVAEGIQNDGGFLRFNFVANPNFGGSASNRYELMGGTGYANADSLFAKNDLMTPTVSPSDQNFRIYVKPNATGIAHDAALADLPSQVYTSNSVVKNDSGQGNIITTIPITTLSAALQAALPLTLGAGSGGLADGLEADLAYMTFPKLRKGSYNLRNVGSSYAHRDTHARWVRDIPQSLWFQKTFGIINQYPYGATSWVGVSPTSGSGALRSLQADFNSGVDTTIDIGDTANFPFSGVCEIWTNNPNPRLTASSRAIMLTSFAYSGKTATTLTNVMFADPNKGVIGISGAAGNTTVIARNISGDYKHCFILWADMRNDGSADADGGTRKEDFGLLHPIQSNYKVSVVWAETGAKFVDLKLGTDSDIWSISAKNDPAATSLAGTSKAWSDDPSAIMLDYAAAPMLVGKRSNETELNDFYKNWEDTAGAFIVIDLSKFFNVNTEANNGRLAQAAGGNKPLGSYVVESAGAPTLVDSYWYHAAASFQNSEQPILQHQNTYRWVTAETILTQDVVASTPIGQTKAITSAGDSIIKVVDNTVFPATGAMLLGADPFTYTAKGGELTQVGPANLGNDLTGNGTWTTTGGGGTGANGAYSAAYEVNSAATKAATVATNGVYAAPASGNKITWAATTGRLAGTIDRDAGTGKLDPTTIIITRNDAYVSIPFIDINSTLNSGTALTINPVLETIGRLAFNISFSISDGGTGYTSAPTFVFSTSSIATGIATISTDQLLGVTGVSQTAVAGTTVSSQSTVTTLDVEDTSDFPARLGVTAFAGESTAGVIEAMTIDASGNEYQMKYVFTYNSKTATTLNNITYRPVKQSETVDVAAGGLWANDSFTIAGVPSMKAEGTKIRASLGSSFPMGFMLKVDGKVKAPSGGNYYEHDKIRVYQSSALYSDWFKQITLPALSDINNVPILEDFNISGDTAGAGTVESFGSVTDAQNKSILQTLRTMAQSAGVGSGGSLLTLNFQMGRDNRMEFRPTYNSGLSLTRSNLKVSNLKTSKAASFSHIRVLFNGGDSHVTYPALEYKTNVRFKYVNATSVASYDQAVAIAKQEYQKRKEPAFSVEAEVIRESNETQALGPMLSNARYGYIADPAVQLTGRNGGYWTAGRGGLHFSGQNNALQGNTHGYGLLDLITYQSPSVLGIGIGGYTGADSYGVTYGAGQVYYPTSDLYNMFPWTQMYYWYGAKSVSYAVQIVHIPKGMPKVSETTLNELRIFISDAVASIPATDRESNLTSTKKFNIHIADYAFDEMQSLGHVPKLTATQEGIETITTLGSGYFEMPIPASYWAAGNAAGYKMIVSVNAEYLNSLARTKTGDQFGGNASTTQTNVTPAIGQTLPTFTNANEFSIFPLGIREYPELGSSGTSRACWYAPRIQITDDMNFIPGTYAQYTDAYIDIDEIMYITKVEYEYKAKEQGATTKLSLERDSGRIPEGIESYLASNPFNDTGATGGGTGGGGAGGGGSTGGREGTPGGDTSPYIPPPVGQFPGGYTHGQQGTEANKVPLQNGIGADLGLVGTPSLGGDNYLRLNTDTGIQQMGQSGALNIRSVGMNQLDDQIINRISNKMSIDSILPDGIQGIPGQPQPAKLPAKTRAIEGIDTKFVSARGQAAETTGGWVLPGASQLDDSEAPINPVHTLELDATTPMDSAQPVMGMTAIVSCDVLVDSSFSLTTTITSPDTGETISHTYTEALTASTNGISRKSISLVPQQYFAAANVEGQALNVVISRSPNSGSDDALYSSVIVHGVQVQNVVHNNQGTPTTTALSPFSGNEINITDASATGIDVNSNTNPL